MDSPRPSPEISWSGTRFAGNGLRTRFRPSSRIRTFFLFFFPWVDAVLLVLCLRFAVLKKAVTPGILADVPAAPSLAGLQSPILLVVAPPAPTASASLRGPLVFFNSHRYDIATQAADFRASLDDFAGRKFAEGESRNAILFVDRTLPYGDLSDLLVLLREAGVSQVDFATKTP